LIETKDTRETSTNYFPDQGLVDQFLTVSPVCNGIKTMLCRAVWFGNATFFAVISSVERRQE
jgi:hypothetical protein